MRRTPWNIFFHVLVGLEVCVLSHPDPAMVGRCGVVIDETARTLVLRDKSGKVFRVTKRDAIFEFRVGRVSVIAEGELIVGRVEERLKRLEKGRGLVVRYVLREGRWYTRVEAPGENV
ncbi:Ribonuclease P, Rpp29 [Pyrolobus fumarii 1A]|uniref:Ribonuclease P protein component 1 n=1 Tax=Pyrolobus fumarii (strain DSM 11204 / 1A) TaxID=694429 RepID=G0ECF2_PYRF1|nr:ribonuclease P protein subunit [Pyrolobus fumarii]AEM39522.1 Ribonuclease P, Rpp29 [Pyrolobus fumarii 1A]